MDNRQIAHRLSLISEIRTPTGRYANRIVRIQAAPKGVHVEDIDGHYFGVWFPQPAPSRGPWDAAPEGAIDVSGGPRANASPTAEIIRVHLFKSMAGAYDSPVTSQFTEENHVSVFPA
jgi:hypothetical protein